MKAQSPSSPASEMAQKIVNQCNEECMLTDLEGNNLGWDPDTAYTLVEQIVARKIAEVRLEEAKWWIRHLEEHGDEVLESDRQRIAELEAQL